MKIIILKKWLLVNKDNERVDKLLHLLLFLCTSNTLNSAIRYIKEEPKRVNIDFYAWMINHII